MRPMAMEAAREASSMASRRVPPAQMAKAMWRRARYRLRRSRRRPGGEGSPRVRRGREAEKAVMPSAPSVTRTVAGFIEAAKARPAARVAA